MAIYVQDNRFILETDHLSYIFDVKFGYLRHLYYGRKIVCDDISNLIAPRKTSFTPAIPGGKYYDSLDVIPQEYSLYATGDFRYSAIIARNAEGVYACDLLYDSYRILEEKPILEGMPHVRDGQTLVVTLKDKKFGLRLDLYYSVLPECDCIVRSAEIRNTGEREVKLFKAMSFSLDFSENLFLDVLSLGGRHSGEARVFRDKIPCGAYEIGSESCSSSFKHVPFAALLTGNTDLDNGEVLGVSLIYSSSYKIRIETGLFGELRLVGGISDEGFLWNLSAGEIFRTPEVALVYSLCGLNGMTQKFHDLFRNHLMDPFFAHKERPIVANSWEGCFFDVDEKKILDMIDCVAASGVDTFVLDDGWFDGRNNDNTSLGDWTIDKTKFPDGFNRIIDRCKEKGLKFGLWFEPEMISPESKLFKEHPDWAVQSPTRQPNLSRNQLVLDMANPKVIDYLFDRITTILSDYDISYIKWDFNRFVTEKFSPSLGAEKQGEFAHRFILGTYDLLGKIRETFPDVMIETCSGGGGRFDAGMLFYSSQIWASDATDAYERSIIQDGFSICFPLSAISCHVSDIPNVQVSRVSSFKTRADIATFGTYGYELSPSSIRRCRGEMKEYSDRYRQFSPLIREGDYYRIYNVKDDGCYIALIIAKDKSRGILLYFGGLCSTAPIPKRVRLKGLCRDGLYELKQYGIKVHGSTLEDFGIDLESKLHDFASEIIEIVRI